MVSELEMGQKYSKFVFVSDHDKGLEESLQEVFPNNHATHCVHHIKQNVLMRYGKPCAEFSFGLAASYSTCTWIICPIMISLIKTNPG